LLPADNFDCADVRRWMFWEQYNQEPNVATMRFWRTFLSLDKLNEGQCAQLETKWMAGEAALCLMEKYLEARDWFVGSAMTLADICL
jgi:glutathione S-transferase